MAKAAARDRASELEAFSTYGVAVTSVALLLTLASGWYASSQSVSTLDQTSLNRLADSLESYAAESHLITSEYRDNRAPSNYVKVSALKLHGAVTGLSDDIQEQQVQPPVAHKAYKLTQQADDLSQALSDLSRLPSNRRAAQLDQKIVKVQQEASKPL
jgi:hypothetical protein